MKIKELQTKVEDFIVDNEDKVIGGVVFTGCMITGLIGIKLGKKMAYNGTQITKFVYNDKGNLAEKYIVKFIK